MTDRGDQRLGVEREILYLVDEHPHDTAQRNQEADDGFDQQHRRRQTAPPPAANRQIAHLPPKQHIDRHGAEQPADIGRQFGEDNHTQYQNDDEERITPVLFLDTSHPPTRLSSGIKSKECAGFPATGTKRHATGLRPDSKKGPPVKNGRILSTPRRSPETSSRRRYNSGLRSKRYPTDSRRPSSRKLRPYTSPYFQRSRARLPIRRIRFVHAPPGESFRCRRS